MEKQLLLEEEKEKRDADVDGGEAGTKEEEKDERITNRRRKGEKQNE